jgi:hypothetical protein
MTQLVNIPPYTHLFTCCPILKFNEQNLSITKQEYTKIKKNIDLKTLAQIWINGFFNDNHSIGSYHFSVLMRCGYNLRPVNPARDFVDKLKSYFYSKDNCKTIEGAIVYRAMPEKYINIPDSNFITTTTSIDIAYRYYKFLNLKLNKCDKYKIIAIELQADIPVLYIGGPDKEVLLPPGILTRYKQKTILHKFINNHDDLKRIIGIANDYAGDDYDELLKCALKADFNRPKYIIPAFNTEINTEQESEKLQIDFYNYTQTLRQIGGKNKISYSNKYLYEIATLFNIKNRSKMNKKQIIKSISII